MDYKYSAHPRLCTKIVFFYFLLTCFIALGQSEAQIQKIKAYSQLPTLRAFTGALKDDFTVRRKLLMQAAEANGWKISEMLPNGGLTALQDIGPDGTPIYYTTFSDYATNVSRANALYGSGLLHLGIDGQGMKVGIWDGGTALAAHQEFGARVAVGDNTGETNAHATMVMGTLISKGIKEKAKGVAFNANAVSHDWTRDKIEVAEAAANGLLVSNHSYGIQTDRVPDWYFGSYIKVAQEWDHIMYNAPFYLMVTAAGNAQKLMDNATPIYGTSTDGFDLMLGFALAKNGITVTAADTKIDSKGRLTQANITGYSSFGPVDDGRIKPDIAGAGGSIFSTSSSSTNAYGTSFGTSMATPGITGSLLLLQQYYEELHGNYMKAATLKGLALHSADDVNEPGPDYKMGWGVMNAMAAATLVTDNGYGSLIMEEELGDGAIFEIKVKANGNSPLVASISWTDPASGYVNTGILNDSSPALVNDLDVRIFKDGSTFYPWKLSALHADQPASKGDNRVDPFEKVQLDNAVGEYIIRVSHKGSLKNGPQQFALIVSGIMVTDCLLIAPTEIAIGEANQTSVQLIWEPIQDAIFEVQYSDMDSDVWITAHTQDNSVVLHNLVSGKGYKFRVRTLCTENKASEYSAVFQFKFMGTATALGAQDELQTLSVPGNMAISIYPNPATEYIIVNGNRSAIAKYRILSMAGVILQQGDVDDAGIDVNRLSAGLYLLLVWDLEGQRSTKFYKG